MTDVRIGYNERYKIKNFYGYNEALFTAYVESLVKYTGLKKGATVLDAGCGQGFFSYLFCKCGMSVSGVDLSEEGIKAATNTYRSSGVKYAVGDIFDIPFSIKYDCVFVRSCSLYNTIEFTKNAGVTEKLLGHIKKGGLFIFAYNTKFTRDKKSDLWIYHSLDDLHAHFKQYPNARMFFLNRIDTFICGKYALNTLMTKLNISLSKYSGFGGDLVCVLRV